MSNYDTSDDEMLYNDDNASDMYMFSLMNALVISNEDHNYKRSSSTYVEYTRTSSINGCVDFKNEQSHNCFDDTQIEKSKSRKLIALLLIIFSLLFIGHLRSIHSHINLNSMSSNEFRELLCSKLKQMVANQDAALLNITQIQMPAIINVYGPTGTGKTSTFAVIRSIIPIMHHIDVRYNSNQFGNQQILRSRRIYAFDSVTNFDNIVKYNDNSLVFVITWDPILNADYYVRFNNIDEEHICDCVKIWIAKTAKPRQLLQNATEFTKQFLEFFVDDQGRRISKSGCKHIDAKLRYFFNMGNSTDL
ncbi:hypothetical protein GJ496_003587 [Pomphorhynchus laevis]|nr:hypothetical protein GJ496_003587 [Pomphorhynchus laevis]